MVELSRFNKLCTRLSERTPEGDYQAVCRNCDSVYRIHPSGMIIDCDRRLLDDCPHCIHKVDAILDREAQQRLAEDDATWGAF